MRFEKLNQFVKEFKDRVLNDKDLRSIGFMTHLECVHFNSDILMNLVCGTEDTTDFLDLLGYCLKELGIYCDVNRYNTKRGIRKRIIIYMSEDRCKTLEIWASPSQPREFPDPFFDYNNHEGVAMAYFEDDIINIDSLRYFPTYTIMQILDAIAGYDAEYPDKYEFMNPYSEIHDNEETSSINNLIVELMHNGIEFHIERSDVLLIPDGRYTALIVKSKDPDDGLLEATFFEKEGVSNDENVISLAPYFMNTLSNDSVTDHVVTKNATADQIVKAISLFFEDIKTNETFHEYLGNYEDARIYKEIRSCIKNFLKCITCSNNSEENSTIHKIKLDRMYDIFLLYIKEKMPSVNFDLYGYGTKRILHDELMKIIDQNDDTVLLDTKELFMALTNLRPYQKELFSKWKELLSDWLEED